MLTSKNAMDHIVVYFSITKYTSCLKGNIEYFVYRIIAILDYNKTRSINLFCLLLLLYIRIWNMVMIRKEQSKRNTSVKVCDERDRYHQILLQFIANELEIDRCFGKIRDVFYTEKLRVLILSEPGNCTRVLKVNREFSQAKLLLTNYLQDKSNTWGQTNVFQRLNRWYVTVTQPNLKRASVYLIKSDRLILIKIFNAHYCHLLYCKQYDCFVGVSANRLIQFHFMSGKIIDTKIFGFPHLPHLKHAFENRMFLHWENEFIFFTVTKDGLVKNASKHAYPL